MTRIGLCLACGGFAVAMMACGREGGSAPEGGSGGSAAVGGSSGAGGVGGTGAFGGSGGQAGTAGTDDDSGVSGSGGTSGAGATGGGDASLVRMNELQVAGTHNSYHVKPNIVFDGSHNYTHRPLNEQLEGGVRALELDVHQGASALETYHIGLALVDPVTTCMLFRDCLQTIETWSDAHPNHTPIFVWLEIKDDTGGSTITDLLGVEADINSVFGDDDLITPQWLKGSHATARARIDAEGWPLLSEARGRVMFIVLNRDDHAQEYTHDFTNLDDRIMFANAVEAQFDMPWVVVAKIEGDLEQPAIAVALGKNLLTATNVCGAAQDDATCTMRNAQAVASGFHMLKDDFPFTVSNRSYALTLPAGSPGCNPVTGTDACDATQLEQ